MPDDLTPLTPFPVDPGPPLQAAIGPALLRALLSNDPMPLQAWFESMKRTDPREFRRWVELAMRMPPVPQANNVVNIINAIPRSHLDELPVGYEVRPPTATDP